MVKNAEDLTKIKASIYSPDPKVKISDHYDRLLIPSLAQSRTHKDAKILDDTYMLRAHTSVHLPLILDQLDLEKPQLVIVYGTVHRRDSWDYTHVADPTQVDIWYSDPKCQMDMADVVKSLTKDICQIKINETSHPYTLGGLEVEGEWLNSHLEIGEGGRINKSVVNTNGWASGWGLERLAMCIKNIPDIRLLRKEREDLEKQWLNWDEYKEIRNGQIHKRHLSLALKDNLDDEDIGGILSEKLEIEELEKVQLIEVTKKEDLLPHVQERLGIQNGQSNYLIEIIIRPKTGHMNKAQLKAIDQKIYLALK